MATSRRGFGSLYQRHGIWYLNYSVDGRQYRLSSRSRERGVAATMLKAKLAEAAETGRAPARAERLTVADLLAQLIRALDVRPAKAGTRATLRSLVKHHLGPFFGSRRAVGGLTADLVRQFIQREREAGYADATIANALTYLKRAYQLAVDDEVLRPGHVPPVPEVTVQNVRMVFITPAEFVTLHHALAAIQEDYADAVLFAYVSGWRKSEVLRMRWANIREETRQVPTGARVVTIVQLEQVRSKNKHPRDLEVAGELTAILAKRRARRRPDCPYVFHRDGQRMAGRCWWQKACRAIGRSDFWFHDMRRSATRNLRRAGVSEDVAMKVQGHRTRSMFTRYNIVDTTDVGEAMAAVEDYLKVAQRKGAGVVPLRPRRRRAKE